MDNIWMVWIWAEKIFILKNKTIFTRILFLAESLLQLRIPHTYNQNFNPSCFFSKCCFSCCFWEHQYLQMSHLNGFFSSWTDATCLFMWCFRCCSHKCHIWMASFLHEPMQHVYSCDALENTCSHKCHIWMASFLHAQIQHVYSSDSLEKSCSYKCHIWMASFLHELN